MLFCFFIFMNFFFRCSFLNGMIFSSFVIFWCFLILYGLFDKNYSSYQFLYLKHVVFTSNIQYCFGFGIDGISFIFILLTTLLFILTYLTGCKYNLFFLTEYCYCLFSLEIFLIAVFSAIDLISFFFLFESVLIPMFLIIGFWGTVNRKVYASMLFFLFTLLGSIALLFVIVLLYYDFGTFCFNILNKVELNNQKELFLWVLGFISFAVKIPIFPFHIWLPEAHVEAPSVGSVILAGILLKLGGYGILRILLSIFSNGCFFFLPLIYVFSIISILYASLTAIRQLDLKRIIAYSSIAHMNIIVIGLFSNTLEGLLGGTFLMVGHGLVSSLLFFLIGFLYDRYGTRLLIYYAGLIKTMPLFTFYFLLASLGNIGLPGTSNFIGEFLIFLGIFAKNKILFFYALFSVVLTSIYSLCANVIFFSKRDNLLNTF